MNFLRRWAHDMKREAHAVYLAVRDPRVPWYAKLMGMIVTAYALSPIDLIPDFIPVLGFLDDLLIVPLGLWLTVRMIPRGIMAEHRIAADAAVDRPVSHGGAILVMMIWGSVGLSIILSLWLYRYW